MDTFIKQLKNKIKLKFYLYLESKKHSYQIWLLRMGVSVFAMLFRLPKSLIRVMKSEANNGDFKSVFRRMWWLFNHLLLKGKYRYDRYFDFSIGLDSVAANAMYDRLVSIYSRSGNDYDFNHHIYLAQLVSAGIDGDLKQGEVLVLDTQALKEKDLRYVAHVNSALSMLKNIEPAAYSARRYEKKTVDTETSVVTKENHKTSFSPRKNQFGEYAETVYAAFIELLDSASIPVFAISGTLLGIIRENAFLAHDYDIDLGVFEEVDFQLLLETIKSSGLFYIKKVDYPSFRRQSDTGSVSYYRYANPALIKVGHRSTGVHIDLFTHFHEDDVMWHGSTLHRWDNTPFTLTQKTFLGLKVRIPEDYDCYLSENYGDWRTPITEFNCSTGTPNASISSNPRTLCYYVKLSYDNQANMLVYNGLAQKLLASKLVTQQNNTYSLTE